MNMVKVTTKRDMINGYPREEYMTLVLTFASLFAAAIPMLVFLFLVWRWDLYDRKPLWLIGGAFLWGALGSVPLAIVGQILFDPWITSLLGSEAYTVNVAIGAPLTEEPAKALILVLLIRAKRFNNICDGFVFGAAAGLGFGMTENAKYFIESALQVGEYVDGTHHWIQLVVTRTLFSAVMHAAATSLVGAATGLGKIYRGSIRAVLVSIGMALAMAMHALWNGLLVTEILPGKEMLQLSKRLGSGVELEPFVYSAFFFIIELSLILFLFALCTWWEGRVLRASLERESKKGLIPEEHVPFLASYWKRDQNGWLREDIPQREYVRLATHLAQRGRQVALLSEKRRKWYELDYRRIKEEINDILHPVSSNKTS